MTLEVMNTVWEHSKEKGTKRLVLLALADAANHDGYCWPGIEYIARRCKCSGRYIIKIIAELEQSGEIFAAHRPGRNRGNVYFVTVNTNIEDFAKRLVHYLDYKPTEALRAATEHLRKGELLSQKVNPSSPLTGKLKVNNSSEKVNNSSVKVNPGREKVNSSSPDPKEPSFDPNEQQQPDPDPTPPSVPQPESNGRGRRQSDENYADVCTKYENEIGTLTPTIAEKLGALVDEHSKEWIIEAFDIAATNNARNLAYVSKVLSNWKTDGRGGKPNRPTTYANGAAKPAATPATPTAARRRQFREWLLSNYHTDQPKAVPNKSLQELESEFNEWSQRQVQRE